MPTWLEAGLWGLLGGAVAYLAANAALARHGARHRKRSGGSPGEEQPSEDEQSGSGTAIAVGALLDGVPESVVFGLGLLSGGGVSLSVLAAVFISNVPAGLTSAAGMKAKGRSAGYVFGVWGGIAVVSALAALLGYVLLGNAPPEAVAVITAVAAGAILTMIADTMIPEAFERTRTWTGVIATVGSSSRSPSTSPGETVPVTELRDPQLLTVPVAGGDLSVLRWEADGADAPVAVLLHGITSNAMVWARVAHELAGEFQLVAPDLRGRAGSARLPAPYGLAAHADDVAALLDRFGDAVLAGHSMGGFVAALAASGVARYRTRGLVLVDGGVPFPQPPGEDADAMLGALLGSTLDRLGRTFPDLAAVRAFWARHPTVGPWVDVPSVAAFLARDLVGTAPHLYSACRAEAVRRDGADMLLDERVLAATADLPVPATLLWAPRGMTDQPPGLYHEDRLARLGAGVRGVPVPDTNHDSILWASQGVAAVADAVRAAAR